LANESKLLESRKLINNFKSIKESSDKDEEVSVSSSEK
jgi:hypothetical protein